MAQWKRAGPITQRSVDRNHSLLIFLRRFNSLNFYWKKKQLNRQNEHDDSNWPAITWFVVEVRAKDLNSLLFGKILDGFLPTFPIIISTNLGSTVIRSEACRAKTFWKANFGFLGESKICQLQHCIGARLAKLGEMSYCTWKVIYVISDFHRINFKKFYLKSRFSGLMSLCAMFNLWRWITAEVNWRMRCAASTSENSTSFWI